MTDHEERGLNSFFYKDLVGEIIFLAARALFTITFAIVIEWLK